MTQSTRADLPPQLRALAAKAQDLPGPVRDALLATLSDATRDATREKVLADTFARLGYLPAEATQAAQKVLKDLAPTQDVV